MFRDNKRSAFERMKDTREWMGKALEEVGEEDVHRLVRVHVGGCATLLGDALASYLTGAVREQLPTLMRRARELADADFEKALVEAKEEARALLEGKP